MSGRMIELQEEVRNKRKEILSRPVNDVINTTGEILSPNSSISVPLIKE
jgi:hypothetical protein